MEILFISHKYPPSIGGMEKHAFELLTRLEENHNIRKLIYDNKEGRVRFFRLLERRAKAMLKKYPNIDLIYVNEGLLACFAARLKRFTNIPMIATVHGLDVVFPNSIYQYFVKKQLSKLDTLIAVSQATANACIERGIDKEKILVVNNGIDHDLATVSTDPSFLANFEKQHGIQLKGKKILISMGRPVKRKGFSWFVWEVMPKLSKDTILLLIGPRKGKSYKWLSYLPSFMAHTLELALNLSSDELLLKEGTSLKANQQRVFELGKLPFAEVIQLLKIAHLFVMPNKRVKGDMEGFGLVALESAICGTPVLAAGIEGIRDAVQDGKNGWQAPPMNAQKWKEKIESILVQPEKLVTFSQAAKDYTLKRFSWWQMVEDYEAVFEELGEGEKVVRV